jgi:hypothetical protein
VPQSAGDSTHTGILATGPSAFGTRPICPWPTTAIYNGTGSTAVASNYQCGGNLDAFPPTPATNNVATICEDLITRANGQGQSNDLDYKEQGISPSQCSNLQKPMAIRRSRSSKKKSQITPGRFIGSKESPVWANDTPQH